MSWLPTKEICIFHIFEGIFHYGKTAICLNNLVRAPLGMVEFSKFLEFPTCLRDVPGMREEHIERCLKASKDLQLDMKLRNMPVPLNADLVEEFMRPILEAAWGGKFEKIKNM